MAQVNIKEIVDFITKDNCPFSRDEVYTALTVLNMEGKNIGRNKNYQEESDFVINSHLCGSIDSIIKNLKALKQQGWEEIDQSDDYFYAYKHAEEPDNEYKSRLLFLVKMHLASIIEDNDHIIQKINEKKKEIAELEKKLNKNN